MTPRNRGPVQILLVEDSPADVLLTREALALSKLDLRLHVAEHGIEALDFLHRRAPHQDAPRPDLVLLDLNLPLKDGREVLAEIKGDPRLKTIPVVVLTTSQSEEDVHNAYGLNANCYITKPVDFGRFVMVVRSIRDFWFTTATLPWR